MWQSSRWWQLLYLLFSLLCGQHFLFTSNANNRCLAANASATEPPTYAPSQLPRLPQPLIFPDETENILSVTVRMVTEIEGATIYYTLDGSTPTTSSASIASDAPLFIDTIGEFTVKCFAWKRRMQSSFVSEKRYRILDRCAQPALYPGEGSYPGAVTITVSSVTAGASVCYTLGLVSANISSYQCINSGDELLIDEPGTYRMEAWSTADGMADSTIVTAQYTVLAQVKAPTITPDLSTFAISATLMVSCPTVGATIYYTVDGSDPTVSSLMVTDGEPVVITGTGAHELRAFAVMPPLLPSGITSKIFTILKRLSKPTLHPPAGHYVGNVMLQFSCPDGGSAMDAVSEAQALTSIHYTTNGVSTPTESSPHVSCGESIELEAPGTIVVRAIEVNPYKSTSAVTQGEYTLSRPPYDQWPIGNHKESTDFSVGPDVEVLVVEKDFESLRCPDRNIRGRLVKLRNANGHFSILPPLDGCSSGKLELPSVSGRWYIPKTGFNLTSFVEIDFTNGLGEEENSVAGRRLRGSSELHHQYSNEHIHQVEEDAIDICDSSATQPLLNFNAEVYFAPDTLEKVPQYVVNSLRSTVRGNDDRIRIDLDHLYEMELQYHNIRDFGCEVVTNAGFFDTETNNCIGDVVTDGIVHQTSDTHNVNFGIRNGSFVVGYVDKDEILNSEGMPFDVLISGIGWLVRYGKSYVSESFSRSGDGEDMGAQSTGNNFITVQSARTAIGHDREGNLLILQVEGETWVRGMNLYEFADLAVELGFYSAINLDGGGSATMTQNHSLISEPSWKCPDAPLNASDLFRCEKRVASVTCVHAMAPPFIDRAAVEEIVSIIRGRNEEITTSPSLSPSRIPTALPKQHTTSPSLSPTTPPTVGVTDDIESYYYYYFFDGDAGSSGDDDDISGINNHDSYDDYYNDAGRNETILSYAQSMESAVYFYQICSLTLGALLLLSVTLHIAICCHYRRKLTRIENGKLLQHDYHNGGENQHYEGNDFNAALSAPTAVHDPAEYMQVDGTGIQMTHVQSGYNVIQQQHRQQPFSLFGQQISSQQNQIAHTPMDTSSHPDGYDDMDRTNVAREEQISQSQTLHPPEEMEESQPVHWREHLMSLNYEDDSEEEPQRSTTGRSKNTSKKSSESSSKLSKVTTRGTTSRLRRPKKGAQQSDSSTGSSHLNRKDPKDRTAVESSETVELYGNDQDSKPLILKRSCASKKVEAVSITSESKKKLRRKVSNANSEEEDDAAKSLLHSSDAARTKTSNRNAIGATVSSVAGKVFGRRQQTQQEEQYTSESSME